MGEVWIFYGTTQFAFHFLKVFHKRFLAIHNDYSTFILLCFRDIDGPFLVPPEACTNIRFKQMSILSAQQHDAWLSLHRKNQI